MAVPFFQRALHDSLLNGKYSDLTLKCDDHDFKFHKVIVCSHSDVFAAATNANFLVRSFGHEFRHHPAQADMFKQEASTGCIVIKEFDRTTVNCMLDFMYTGTYNLLQTTAGTQRTEIVQPHPSQSTATSAAPSTSPPDHTSLTEPTDRSSSHSAP